MSCGKAGESFIREKKGDGKISMNLLKQPIKAGNIRLSSRLVMAPMETGKAENNRVTPALLRYYDEKSRGGSLGLIVTEHCYVSPEGQAGRKQLSAASDDCIKGLRELADTIHQNSVPVILQLSHAGSKTDRLLTGLNTISASAVNIPGRAAGADLPKEMTQADIDRVTACFAAAAVRAKEAGYDGVEIHSAHGYLLNQFYSPLTNKRVGYYAGTNLAGRTRLHVGIIEEIRKAAGPGFLISVRLGACDYMEGGSGKEEAATVGKIFEIAGADMISVTGGMCDFVRPGHQEQGWFSELSECIKKEVGIPVLLTGGITQKAAAQRLLMEEKADLIGVGRAILKDSTLPEQFLKDEGEGAGV